MASNCIFGLVFGVHIGKGALGPILSVQFGEGVSQKTGRRTVAVQDGVGHGGGARGDLSYNFFFAWFCAY